MSSPRCLPPCPRSPPRGQPPPFYNAPITPPGRVSGAFPQDFDLNHPYELLRHEQQRGRELHGTQPGRDELLPDQWRRIVGREPTAQDWADARLLVSNDDRPRRGGDGKQRTRLVYRDRNRVARKHVPGGRIPKRKGGVRERERNLVAFFRRTDARLAAVNGNTTDVTDEEDGYDDERREHEHRGRDRFDEPPAGQGGGGVLA